MEDNPSREICERGREKKRISPIYHAMGSVWDTRVVQHHSPVKVQQPFVTKSGASRRPSQKEILHCSAWPCWILMPLSLTTRPSHKQLGLPHHLGHAVDGRVGSERMLRSFRVPVAFRVRSMSGIVRQLVRSCGGGGGRPAPGAPSGTPCIL